tara:strand:- start:234 stop:413 length:180 start_codon:yes stop_codon:yes gene_type:complete
VKLMVDFLEKSDKIIPVMRDEIQVEEVFTENWEQLIDEIMEQGLDLVWNQKTEKYEKKS